MYEDFKKTILATEKNAQYDNAAKQLLSNKILLAHILVHTVDEFKGMNPDDVVNLIEGEPKINKVFVDTSLTNAPESDDNISKTITGERINGYNNEASEMNEGYIRYDIIFYVMTKDGEAKIIINIEAQKSEPQKYDILNRAIFYVCRMISSQKEREFENSNYNDLKKVYSIWICMNIDEPCLNHIHLVNEKLVGSHEWKGNLDLPNIILIGLPKEVVKKDKDYELHRLLGTLLSMNMKAEDKIKIVRDEFAIKFSEEMRKEVSSMCNLSEGIFERGLEVGVERGIAVGEKRGIERGIAVGEERGGVKQMIEMGLEFGLTEDSIIARLQQRFSISLEKAKEYFEMFKDDGNTLSNN